MRIAAFAAAFLVIASRDAEAHTVIDGMGGFPGGLLHPLLVPAHTLTLIALGLLASTFCTRNRFAILLALPVAAVLAFVLIAMAYSTTNAEQVVLCLGAAIGLSLAADFIPPAPLAAMLAACVTGGIMFDSVPSVLTVQETVLSLTETTLAAMALVAVTAWLTAALPSDWRRIGIRIAGSWIAASAVMVLALRLA